MSHVRIFVEKDGVPVHVELTEETGLASLFATMTRWLTDLEEHGFSGHQGFSGGRQPSRPSAPVAEASNGTQEATAPPTALPHCGNCGGDVYDNRADIASGKRSAKSPSFRCKECAFSAWFDKNGGLTWKPPLNR